MSEKQRKDCYAEIYPTPRCLNSFPSGAAFGAGYTFGKPKAAPNPGLHFSTHVVAGEW